MRLNVTDTVIIGGTVIEPGVGNFEPGFAAELIKIGSAYEVKSGEVVEEKKVEQVKGQTVGETFTTKGIDETLDEAVDPVIPSVKKEKEKEKSKSKSKNKVKGNPLTAGE